MSRHFFSALLIVFALAAGPALPVKAQIMDIDSLKRELEKPISDSQKVLLLLDISESYQAQQNVRKCEEFNDKALALSQKAGYRRGVAMSLMHKGYVQLQENNFPQSLDLLQEALAL